MTIMPRLWGNEWNGDERKGRGKSRVGSTFGCWSFTDALTDYLPHTAFLIYPF